MVSSRSRWHQPATSSLIASNKQTQVQRMFMNFTKGSLGWIEVVAGPMFSGKSEELIRRLRRAEIARQRVQIFKPGIDQRYSDDHIVSHSDLKILSECVKDAAELEKRLDWRTEVIGIDEAQFLGEGIVGLVVRMADMGKRVIIAGLDTDYLGRPFHPMPELMAIADEIVKVLDLHAVRQSRKAHAAPHRQRRTGRSRCRRYVRSTLSSLFRAEPLKA